MRKILSFLIVFLGFNLSVLAENIYFNDLIYKLKVIDSDLPNIENEYFIDSNICNFVSPDSKNVESGIKFRLVGYTDIKNSISCFFPSTNLWENIELKASINNKYKNTDHFKNVNNSRLLLKCKITAEIIVDKAIHNNWAIVIKRNFCITPLLYSIINNAVDSFSP